MLPPHPRILPPSSSFSRLVCQAAPRVEIANVFPSFPRISWAVEGTALVTVGVSDFLIVKSQLVKGPFSVRSQV